MLQIDVKNGNIEGALKEYKRKVQSVKQIEQLRDRQTYTKPSVEKRLLLEEAKRKNKKIVNLFSFLKILYIYSQIPYYI